jgi:hypothetical protein
VTLEALISVAEKLMAKNPALVEDARQHPGNTEVGAALGLVCSAPRWLTEQAVAEALLRREVAATVKDQIDRRLGEAPRRPGGA